MQRSQSRELEGKRVLTGKVTLSIFPSDFFLCALCATIYENLREVRRFLTTDFTDGHGWKRNCHLCSYPTAIPQKIKKVLAWRFEPATRQG